MLSATEHHGTELKQLKATMSRVAAIWPGSRCLQWLVEHGADTTTPDLNGYTPQQPLGQCTCHDPAFASFRVACRLIHINNRNEGQEMEWLEALSTVLVEMVDLVMASGPIRPVGLGQRCHVA